ncbi:MAG: hypothetical protein GY835_27430 [bacterium]|nr:hypothetical protein [bacterium]
MLLISQAREWVDDLGSCFQKWRQSVNGGGLIAMAGSILGISALFGLGAATSCFCRFHLGRLILIRFGTMGAQYTKQ